MTQVRDQSPFRAIFDFAKIVARAIHVVSNEITCITRSICVSVLKLCNHKRLIKSALTAGHLIRRNHQPFVSFKWIVRVEACSLVGIEIGRATMVESVR